MKYLAYSLILIAFSASMFGQSKTVQTGFTHYEVTADPKNGQSCLAGTAFCIGGRTDTISIPADGCVPAKKQLVTIAGTYSNFIKGLDNDLSTLTEVAYTVKRKSDNVALYSVTISKGAGWPTIPTTFTANLQVSPFTNSVPGTYYRSADGILTIISPSIPGAAASNTETLVVTVDPTCSPTASYDGTRYTSVGGVDETYTQEYSATAIAAMSKTGKLIPGDVKYSELSSDHDGWYLMDGRSISSISNVSAKQAAAAIFTSVLPDMDNKYMIGDRTSATRETEVGQNYFTVANNNIQEATLTTDWEGNHSHPGSTVFASYAGSESFFPGGTPGDGNEWNTTIGLSINGDGAHDHKVTIGTASPTSIDNRPVSKKMYAFVYLGE